MMRSKNALCQAVVLIAVWLLTGCGEGFDSGYRESTEARYIPTIHLVVDHEYGATDPAVGYRSIGMGYHIQSDRPMERDTFILMRQFYGIPNAHLQQYAEAGTLHEFNGIPVYYVGDRLVVIFAGRTQSVKFDMLQHNSGDLREWGPGDQMPEDWRDFIPIAGATLLEPHERARLLPMRFDYRDGDGRQQSIEMLVEYPFNPYRVGNPKTIVRKWNDQ